MQTVNTEVKAQLIKQHPLIERYRNKSYLIKYGGAAMDKQEVKKSVCQEIAILASLGIRIIVVHGGGKEISRTLERLSIPSKFIGGLRVTSPEAMSAIEMVLSGNINKDLASLITQLGAPAIGISGRDAHILEGTTIKGLNDSDLGLAGEVALCDPNPINAIVELGYIPVLSPVAETSDGKPININADYAAATLAGALKTSACIFLTDVDGVRRSGRIEESLSPQLIDSMISDGTITGGMIPKVQCALKALSAGCPQATICNAERTFPVTNAILRAPGAGTVVEQDKVEQDK
jgi:acetylglutamate kinase